MGGFSGTINEGTVWRMNTTKHIGIVVALPEERVALVKKLQKVKRRLVDGIPFYTGTLEGRLVSVVEGGMGTTAASHAARLLIAADRPNLLLSAGFCGAIRPGVRVADLVICKRSRPVLVLHERKTRVTLMARLAGKTAAETLKGITAHRVIAAGAKQKIGGNTLQAVGQDAAQLATQRQSPGFSDRIKLVMTSIRAQK